MSQDAPNRGTKRTTSGFTLIELMITIAVAAILITIAIPSFKSIISGNNVTNTYYDLMAALRTARSEAVTRGAPVSVKANDANWDAWDVIDSGGQVLRSYGERDSKYQVIPAPAGVDEVRFNSAGAMEFPVAPPVCFTFKDTSAGASSKLIYVTVPKSGAIYSSDSC